MGPLLLPMLIVANVFGVAMIVPQAVRLHRTKVADGVSAAWVGVSLATNFWWLGYGLEGRLWGIVPVSVGSLVVYGIVATQVLRPAGPAARGPLTIGVVGSSLGFLMALSAVGWSGVGLALGLAYGLQFGPAAASAIRSADPAGISPATWTMALIEALVWIVYGTAIADPALVIGGVGGSLMASIILSQVFARRAGTGAVSRTDPAPVVVRLLDANT